ncbi:MAG: LysE family transporter [Chloroflexi bacterium]|nr:LysE family transporter [Chloroflexota bacterium]
MRVVLITFFLQGAALGFTAAAAPGSFQAFVISQTLAGGWRRAAPIALAPLITDGPIILLTQILLGQVPPIFVRGISLVGGLFVIYLAWGLWRGWRAGAGQANGGNTATANGGLWRGVLMNFLSPGPYTFWAFVAGPILLSAWRESPSSAASFVLGFYVLMIATLLMVAGLFHQARRLGPMVVRGMLLASIVILVVFAGILLRQGVSG